MYKGLCYGVHAMKLEYKRIIRIHDEASIFIAKAVAIKHTLRLFHNTAAEQGASLSTCKSRSEASLFSTAVYLEGSGYARMSVLKCCGDSYF
ncbi:hypothetical protein Trydic_g5341 [Trypoxylus dichotomus]